MRSRYAAYALGLVDYVLATTAPDGPQARPDREAWAADVAEFARRTAFVSLELEGSGTRGERGWVAFRAGLREGEQDRSFRERSEFVRRDGRWYYLSGA